MDKKSVSDKILIEGLKEPVLQINLAFADTVGTELKKGELLYYRQLPDTLKLGADDERFLTLYINYFPHKENPPVIAESSCDSFVAYSKKNIDQPMQIKFQIQNDSLKGLNYLRGKIVDQIILRSYSDSLSVRMLEQEYYFDKSVYFKY